jgi:hypothetical protein
VWVRRIVEENDASEADQTRAIKEVDNSVLKQMRSVNVQEAKLLIPFEQPRPRQGGKVAHYIAVAGQASFLDREHTTVVPNTMLKWINSDMLLSRRCTGVSVLAGERQGRGAERETNFQSGLGS